MSITVELPLWLFLPMLAASVVVLDFVALWLWLRFESWRFDRRHRLVKMRFDPAILDQSNYREHDRRPRP